MPDKEQPKGSTWDYDEWLERNPLRKWRISQSMTAAELAVRIGVSLSVVSTWERGLTVPPLKRMRVLRELIGHADLSGIWQEWIAEARVQS